MMDYSEGIYSTPEISLALRLETKVNIKQQLNFNDSVTLGEPEFESKHLSDKKPNKTKKKKNKQHKQHHKKTPLQRLLKHLLRLMEKHDPEQFFALPVTEDIAPDYSKIITNPMDFSKIKQKIDDNNYQNLNKFTDDFKLMCDNAMTYNHRNTIYFKTAQKLLRVGLKMVTPNEIKQLKLDLVYMQDLTKEELGFELGNEGPNNSDFHIKKEKIEKQREQEAQIEEAEEPKKENQRKMRLAHLCKFEAIPKVLTPEEIYNQFRSSSEKGKLLKQKKDGATSLKIIVPGDGVIPSTNQRPMSLGQLMGKLSHGTGALTEFMEDRRNMSKPVKPLYYGAYTSYAPSFDSTFASFTKEESDLVYQIYATNTDDQHAESIENFTEDCDYTLTMVDGLLDILSNGDHRKSKEYLEEKRRLKEKEEDIKHLQESIQDVNRNIPSIEKVKVDIDQLKTLSDIGINVNFLQSLEDDIKTYEECAVLQTRLDDTSSMLSSLWQAQQDRLSAPLPQHLSNIPKPSKTEIILADKIAENLANIAKKLSPSTIAPADGLRKAMGIAPLGGPEPMEVEPITI